MADELVLGRPCEEVASRAVKLLNTVGFRVVQSFDLRAARSLIPDCACPHHGTVACDCQYIVLLVYDRNYPPLTLVIHGHDGYSWLVLADSPSEAGDPRFPESVIQMLSPEHFLTFEGD